MLGPPVEGSLAPRPVTPTSIETHEEPLREIPGRRKRERTWKDEVRDRVRDRRQNRSESEPELPLFPEEGAAPADSAAESVPADAPGLDEADEDLEFRPRDEPAPRPQAEPVRTASAAREELRSEWSLGSATADEPAPTVERPAQPGERIQAAALDALVLIGLWGGTLYCSARVARVPLMGLLPSWPYLVSYLMFLGAVYAAYFTGMTGQTLGKMALGLYVVDASGRPPGHFRAFARVALGGLGVMLAGASVVPMFFDPARRGLHDRLLRTRVIRV